jgi:uncharacterized phage protein (TIGR02220 family)
VHLSIANHPTYGHVFADPLLRGVIVGIWVIAARAHISATNDELTLTTADIGWITGKDRMVDAAKLLRRACEAAAYCLRISCDRHATCVRNTCQRPARWVIQVRNFSRKQGFTPQTPAETPRSSAASEEPKNQRTNIPHSATPPFPEISAESDKPIPGSFLLVEKAGRKLKQSRSAKSIPSEYQPTISKVVGRINELAGTHYRDDRPVALRDLIARLNEGRTEAECLAIIEGRFAAWKGNDKMLQYFRPSTLFAAGHFEDYLQHATRTKAKTGGGLDGGFVV